LQILKDAIVEGLQFSIKITGYIDTDLGRVNVQFTKDFGTGNINGIGDTTLECDLAKNTGRKKIYNVKKIVPIRDMPKNSRYHDTLYTKAGVVDIYRTTSGVYYAKPPVNY